MLVRCLDLARRLLAGVLHRAQGLAYTFVYVTRRGLPGRLGLLASGETDDRADPRLLAFAQPVGPWPVTRRSPVKDCVRFFDLVEARSIGDWEKENAALPDISAAVRRSVRTVSTRDGCHDLVLHIHTPTVPQSPDGTARPCIYHIHGGGMCIFEASHPAYARWRDEMCARGCVAVGPEFRTGAGRQGPHPFPAGLEDLVHGLRWVCAQKRELGVGSVIVQGDSGGANLALALALRVAADRDPALEGAIAGLYLHSPFCSNKYAVPRALLAADLPSLVENDGTFATLDHMAVYAHVYGGGDRSVDDRPLAWTHKADVKALAPLPPTALSLNDLDPLRDEGADLHYRLRAAGVPGYCRNVLGTLHDAEVAYPAAIPEVAASLAEDVCAFARARAHDDPRVQDHAPNEWRTSNY